MGEVAVDRDVFERVGFRNSAVDYRVFFGRETAEHDAEHAHERHNVASQHIGRRLVFARRRQVKRVDMVLGVERDIEVAPTHCLRQELVFPLRVYHYHFSIEHECAEYLELGRITFAGARLCENN